MSNAVPHLPTEGPTQDDCGRLLVYLRHEYIRDLRLEVGFYDMGTAGYGLKLEVLDERPEGVDGKELVNVWATKTIGNRLFYISTKELYDLLLTAYRTIDRFFDQGEAFAPARREK